jgi:hypothetical protein
MNLENFENDIFWQIFHRNLNKIVEINFKDLKIIFEKLFSKIF